MALRLELLVHSPRLRNGWTVRESRDPLSLRSSHVSCRRWFSEVCMVVRGGVDLERLQLL